MRLWIVKHLYSKFGLSYDIKRFDEKFNHTQTQKDILIVYNNIYCSAHVYYKLDIVQDVQLPVSSDIMDHYKVEGKQYTQEQLVAAYESHKDRNKISKYHNSR